MMVQLPKWLTLIFTMISVFTLLFSDCSGCASFGEPHYASICSNWCSSTFVIATRYVILIYVNSHVFFATYGSTVTVVQIVKL